MRNWAANSCPILACQTSLAPAFSMLITRRSVG
jgi:hypothetical protein